MSTQHILACFNLVYIKMQREVTLSNINKNINKKNKLSRDDILIRDAEILNLLREFPCSETNFNTI